MKTEFCVLALSFYIILGRNEENINKTEVHIDWFHFINLQFTE